MVTCLERAGLLCVMFSCVFVTFPCGVPCHVWYLIVSISCLYLLSYFVKIVCPGGHFGLLRKTIEAIQVEGIMGNIHLK